MQYLIDGREYSISYNKLKQEYLNFCNLSDEDFLKKLPAALHLACVICWFKESPTDVVLSDVGIIHQLAHLLHMPDEPAVKIGEIRETFKSCLHLS